MRRALFLLAALLGLSVFATPSRAQFIECTSDYIDTFRIPAGASDPSWSPGQMHCHEFFRYSFSTPAGTRWIRLIGDENAERSMPPGAVAAIEVGARRATRLFSQLGAYRVDDMTMLLGQTRASSAEAQPEFGYDDAWTLSADGPTRRACNITLFVTLNHATVDIHQTVAHEIFHCVQAATLPEEVLDTQTDEGMWWSEGSAEAFGVAAAGSAGGRYNRAAAFEEEVQDRTPLYRLSYEAVVFFFYLIQEDGMDELMPFLRRMASTAGEPAQLEAMRAVKEDDFWSDFAQAYDDRTIQGPGGIPIAFGQRVEGETWRIEGADARQTRQLWPFIIELGWTAYECGAWENTVSRDTIEVRGEHEREWRTWPGDVDTNERGDVRYRLATMITDATAIDFSVSSVKRESCTTCQVSQTIDACMVGIWEQTGGGPMDFLRRQGIPQVVRDNIGKLVIVLNDDGTMSTRQVPVDYTIRIPDGRREIISDGVASIAPSSGRWAASEGRIQACFDSGGESSGVVTMTTQGRTVVMPHSTGGYAGISGSSNYTCNDTTMTTTSQMPSGDAMTYTFRRLTPPPRRR